MGLIELAGQLARDEGNGADIDKLKRALPKLVAAQSTNKARLEAIKGFAETYQCTTEKSDFPAGAPVFDRRRSAKSRTSGGDPDRAVARFDRAIEDARNTREGIDDEDEDLVVTQAGGALGYQPPNLEVPHLGQGGGGDEHPVEDEKGTSTSETSSSSSSARTPGAGAGRVRLPAVRDVAQNLDRLPEAGEAVHAMEESQGAARGAAARQRRRV